MQPKRSALARTVQVRHLGRADPGGARAKPSLLGKCAWIFTDLFGECREGPLGGTYQICSLSLSNGEHQVMNVQPSSCTIYWDGCRSGCFLTVGNEGSRHSKAFTYPTLVALMCRWPLPGPLTWMKRCFHFRKSLAHGHTRWACALGL